MIKTIQRRRSHFSYRFCSFFVLICFVINLSLPSTIFAQSAPNTFLNLPAPGTMLSPSPAFVPTILKGLQIDSGNPLKFNFIVDTGDTKLQGEALKEESNKLIKYFLAALTVPEEELWVNLSPYEKERIIAQGFGVTEMGRDMLAQDYILKQITASLIYPESELGKKFWDRVYQKAREKYDMTDIPVNTFNKVWIVPDQALIYENNGTAFVVENKLKVMLEEDYLALNSNLKDSKFGMAQLAQSDVKGLSKSSSEVIREVVIPELEKEVNTGRHFANLRQIANAVVLAAWYKQNLKQSLLGQVYVDQNKIKGVDVEDKNIKLKIYNQYLEAFKKGVYNYIKEDYDPVTQDTIPRKYFSGGTSLDYAGRIQLAKGALDRQALVVRTRIAGDAAMLSGDGRLVNVAAVMVEETDRTRLEAAIVKPEGPDAAMLAKPTGPKRVGINGFGRIGFNLMRAWLQSPYAIEIVGINDIAFDLEKNGLKALENLANNLRSEFATAPRSGAQQAVIEYGKDNKDYWISVNGKRIKVVSEKEMAKLPWAELKVDVVSESTGRFTSSEAASGHLAAGAKKVIITAPAKGDLVTVAPGVNQELITGEETIYSCASCTTNAIAPVLKIIQDVFGIETFFMATTHAYTADQLLLDGLRPTAPQRGRAAAENIIPTSTGAASAIGDVIPELKGKGHGIALRVPVPDGSIAGMTINVSKPTTKEEVNKLLKAAAEGPLKGIMAYSEKDTVSRDILGLPESSIIDGTLTYVSPDGKTVTVWAWYDNEFGYSNRVVDLISLITNVGEAKEKLVRDTRPIPDAVKAHLETQLNKISRAIMREKATRVDTTSQLIRDIAPVITFNDKGDIEILDEETLRKQTVYYLTDVGRFSPNEEVRKSALRLLREAGIAAGIKEASIHDFYMARYEGKWSNLTVPAYNVRTGPAFNTLLEIFKAAIKQNVGAFILELAASETRYTGQDQNEYMAMVYAAALASGYKGLIFGQADHYQTENAYIKEKDAEKRAQMKTAAIKKVKDNIRKAVLAGKLNIDNDPSTLIADELLKPVLAFERRVTTRYIEERSKVDSAFAQKIADMGGLKEDPEKESDGIWALRRKLTDDLEVGLEIEAYRNSLSAEEIDYLQRFGLTEAEREEIGTLYKSMHAESIEVTKIYIEFIRELEKELGIPHPTSIGVEERHIDNKRHAKFPSTILGSKTLMGEIIRWAKEKGYVQPSKLALQTGTMHGLGGVIDWGIYQRHQLAREYIGVGVFVQHGTSTISQDQFKEMPPAGSGEAHLATEYQKITFELAGKYSPTLRAKMRAYMEGLVYSDRNEEQLDKETVEKIKAAKLWGKRLDSYDKKFRAKWEAAWTGLKDKMTEDEIIIGMLADTLPKPYKGTLKDLVKELAEPFKKEIDELARTNPAFEKENRETLAKEFERIHVAQNVVNSRGVIDALLPFESQKVVLPARSEALQKAIGGVRFSDFQPVTKVPESFAEVLKPYGLSVAKVEAVRLLGGQTAEEALEEIRTQFVASTSIGQALGSILFAGQGSKGKVVADANAVFFSEANIFAFTKANPNQAVAILADEGKRDQSVSLQMGRIYWSGYEGGFKNFTDRKTLEDDLQTLRSTNVQINYFMGDALENTNGLAVEEAKTNPTDSWSLVGLQDDQPVSPRLLVDDDMRKAGVSYNDANDAGIEPLDLPSVAIEKLAFSRGIPEGTKAFANLVNNINIVTLGPRAAGTGKASGDHRHRAIIDDAYELQKKYPGLRIITPGDGDFAARAVASMGLRLDGREVLTFGRSGSAEATIAEVVAALVPNGQFTNRFVSEKATSKNVAPQTADKYTPEEIAVFEQLGYPEGAKFGINRTADFKGKGTFAMTAVTGASNEQFGESFSDAMRRVTFNDDGTVTTNTLVVTAAGSVFILRTQLSAEDIEKVKRAILTASPEAAKFAGADKAMLAASRRPAVEEVKDLGGINLNPALLNLQIKRDGNGVPLPLPQQPIGNMKIEGFLPVIINVTPINNLPFILGIGEKQPELELSRQ